MRSRRHRKPGGSPTPTRRSSEVLILVKGSPKPKTLNLQFPSWKGALRYDHRGTLKEQLPHTEAVDPVDLMSLGAP